MSIEFEVLVLEFLMYIATGVVIGRTDQDELEESFLEEFKKTLETADKFCNNHKST